MVALLAETWTWYAVVTFVLLARLVSRTLHFGKVTGLKLDDLLMIAVLGFYTTEVISLNIVSNAQTNLLPPGYTDSHSFTPSEIKSRVRGSKIVLVVEQCQIATIWLVKTCLLIMYYRVTRGSFRKQNIAIRVLAVYVAFGFIFMEIFYFGVWCRPFHDYWAVPTPNIQCSAAIDHLITNAVFNLSSDVIMLAIALPMFLRSQLPIRRKIVLCSVFSLGLFVIVAAVLNKFYSFTDPFGSEWEHWYIRESSTAVLVANLPFTWTLLRRVFGIKAFDPEDHVYTEESSFESPVSPIKKRFSLIKGRPPSFVDASYHKEPHVDTASDVNNHHPSVHDPSSPFRPRKSSRLSGSSPTTSATQRPGANRHHSTNSVHSNGHRTTLWLGKEDMLAWEGLEDLGDDESETGTKEQLQPCTDIAEDITQDPAGTILHAHLSQHLDDHEKKAELHDDGTTIV